MRVYELAKEMKMDSKRLIDLLHRLHEDVKNHMSTLEDPVIQKVRDIVAGKLPVAPPPGEKLKENKPPLARPAEEAPLPKGANSGFAPQGASRPDRREQSNENVTPSPRSYGGPGAPKPEARPSGYGPKPQGPRTEGGAQGPRPAGQDGQRPPYTPRPAGQDGQRPPYTPRPAGQDGQRPPYTPRPAGQDGPRPPFTPRPGGPPRPGGGYGGPRPQGQGQGQGQRPSGGQDGNRPPYRPGGGPPGAGGANRGGYKPPANAGPKPPPGKPTATTSQTAPKGPGKPHYQNKDRFNNEAAEKRLQRQKDAKGGANKALAPGEKRGTIELGGPLTVKELAAIMQIASTEVIKTLIKLGVMAGINQEIDSETAAIVATEFGFNVIEKAPPGPEPEEMQEEEDPSKLVLRPPVVTVMGHVDHGKTSLLDAIRKTKVTTTEAGGITQHIGASTAVVGDRSIVFLDTPGHEAFTAMRARGAKVTDVAVLVVAANDGVMPQTVEALNHAKAAGIPIVVAVNKIDLPEANPERVKQQLTEHSLVAEEWGGDTIFVPVSAKSGQGMDKLLETLLVVAEVQELKANPSRGAKGTVIEAELDKGRGPVATVLIQNGTLNIGDPFVAGTSAGKVRAMFDDRGKRIKHAGPSAAVEVIGFEEVPEAGDMFLAVGDEKRARELTTARKLRRREEGLKAANRGVSLKDVFQKIKEGETKELSLIVKGDVQGSVEAISTSLLRLSNEEVKVRIIHSGVGGVTESDVMLATASKAIIIGFNVRPETAGQRLADREKVDIRTYRVIYEAVDDIEKAMGGMLEPVIQEAVQGHAEVRATFKVPKIGVVAGCYVNDGKINKSSMVRVVRDAKVIYEGKIGSLRRFKDDVREVLSGYECGIGVERFGDVKEGDVLEAYVMEEISRTAKGS